MTVIQTNAALVMWVNMENQKKKKKTTGTSRGERGGEREKGKDTTKNTNRHKYDLVVDFEATNTYI